MTQYISTELEQIPGIGQAIVRHLRNIGISSISQIKGQDPEKLYEKMCDFQAAPVDRCMLYVLRCSVYYVSNTERDPELLRWWNWKDRES